MFGDLAGKLGHADDAGFFKERAAKLRAAYAPTFLNPATGVLAGWKSKDGQLHDYWFTFVQGVAITYGLLDDKTANAVMDRLLAKMQAVGYANFALGLPGNLVAVRKGDYAHENYLPEMTGEPRLEDGSDGFQSTGTAARPAAGPTTRSRRSSGWAASRTLGGFSTRCLPATRAASSKVSCANGGSRDWRDWKGDGHGYEGLLVDNYLTLLAVLNDVKMPPSTPRRKPASAGHFRTSTLTDPSDPTT